MAIYLLRPIEQVEEDLLRIKEEFKTNKSDIVLLKLNNLEEEKYKLLNRPKELDDEDINNDNIMTIITNRLKLDKEDFISYIKRINLTVRKFIKMPSYSKRIYINKYLQHKNIQ